MLRARHLAVGRITIGNTQHSLKGRNPTAHRPRLRTRMPETWRKVTIKWTHFGQIRIMQDHTWDEATKQSNNRRRLQCQDCRSGFLIYCSISSESTQRVLFGRATTGPDSCTQGVHFFSRGCWLLRGAVQIFYGAVEMFLEAVYASVMNSFFEVLNVIVHVSSHVSSKACHQKVLKYDCF